MRAAEEQERDREFGRVDGMRSARSRCLAPDP